ncbi:hypothetical protein LOC68_15550 [Blastopirellula sp. JC732]|uniref:Uncharacterized protein n=1 Tax=Blastopirellula sediminis TaxID=2894196 RepID=A0A9X1SKJ0_9BACT|nr:hypothetical protein [Blastopirellula sediminis]MCC9606900.1 hypothetical protein [Blastopirellula sediminis]MCC9629804.1 hypothetical protein [Blastopirellula sediminis]
MTEKSEFPERCPSCGLVLLSGAIFDAAAKENELGPILGIHDDVDPEQAKAGYVGIGSVWCYDQSPELYSCPRCKVDPMSKKPDGLIR